MNNKLDLPHELTSRGGFTLIEVLITVAIVGILSAIALPSYKDYVIRGRIPEATAGLSAMQVQMEQFFQDNRTYAGASNPACVATTGKYFNFSCPSAADATSYVLQAAGTGPMNGFTYTVDSTGAKATTVASGSGWTDNASCWALKKGSGVDAC